MIVKGSKICIKTSTKGFTIEEEVEGVRSDNFRGVFTSKEGSSRPHVYGVRLLAVERVPV